MIRQWLSAASAARFAIRHLPARVQVHPLNCGAAKGLFCHSSSVAAATATKRMFSTANGSGSGGSDSNAVGRPTPTAATETVAGDGNSSVTPQPMYGHTFMPGAKISEEDRRRVERELAEARARIEQESKQERTVVPSPMRTADDWYDESDPLSHNMFRMQPQKHVGTLIWLHGIADPINRYKNLFEMWQNGSLRVVVPVGPRIPITSLMDGYERSWFDNLSTSAELREEDEEDVYGIEKSAGRLQSLIDEEIAFLEKSLPRSSLAVAPASSRVYVGGFGHGAALALFTALRYDKPLGGVVSYSGFVPLVDQTVDAAALPPRTAPLPDQEPGKERLAADEPLPLANRKVPVLVIHGEEDKAVPWEMYAQPRFQRLLTGKHLQPQYEMRTERQMGHYMNTKQMFGMYVWVNDALDRLKALEEQQQQQQQQPQQANNNAGKK